MLTSKKHHRIDFNSDAHELQRLESKTSKPIPFNLSRGLRPEVIDDTDQYEQLYPYFWSLIENNCKTCKDSPCYNRYFLKELKDQNLPQHDLYLLTYMTTYFLDLLTWKGATLSQAYYLLSTGHTSVMNYLRSPRPLMPAEAQKASVENYQGYLLGVLYYLLPNFQYPMGQM